jgi:hypothetical protein
LCSVCFNITISGNVGSETGDSGSGSGSGSGVVTITIDVSETVVGSGSGSGVTGFFRRLLGFLVEAAAAVAVALALAVLPGIVNVGIVIKTRRKNAKKECVTR